MLYELVMFKSVVGIGVLEIDLCMCIVMKVDFCVYVDLLVIVKGFGVDQVVFVFDVFGIFDYMVEVGGEVCVKGWCYDGCVW